ALHPDIHLTIDTSHRLVDLTLDDFDIAIRFTENKKPGPNWTLLMAETLLPVCSPALRQQFAGLPAGELVARAPLIHVTSTSADWSYWFRASGIEAPPSIDGRLSVDSMQLGL